MSPWDRLLEKPACGHLVQLYHQPDKSPLIRNVSLYLSEGLQRREPALVIATSEHRLLFNQELQRLGVDTDTAVRKQQFLWLDANETLSRFIMSGWPDWNRFESVIGAAVRELKISTGKAFRGYGEMVDILWKNRQFAAALRLENFWNKLRACFSFSLYCAYQHDNSDQKSGSGNLDEVLATHTHIIPAQCSPLVEQNTSVSVA
jgi:hypothetical protein